jgi:hypothetical protein
VDAGMHIPNLNDGFAGKAPDCGACELGHKMPHFGPRHLVFRIPWLNNILLILPNRFLT